MMSVSLTWVDAFTDTPFAGNPAGVCLLEEPLPADFMQSLAAELGIAETAFVTPTARPDTFGLRWFSPSAVSFATVLEPVFAAVLALAIFHEALSPPAIAGAAILLAAIAVVLRNERETIETEL